MYEDRLWNSEIFSKDASWLSRTKRRLGTTRYTTFRAPWLTTDIFHAFEIGYLLTLNTILIRRKSQQTNTLSNTCFERLQKSPALFGLNFECLLKSFYMIQVFIKGISE